MEIIAGNHDEAVMSLVNNTPYPEDLKDKFYEHHQWIESHMDEDYYDQLNLLPRYIEKLFVEKITIHSLWNWESKIETGIEGQPFSPITENSKENIIELFKDKDADLIAFGHNHQMHLYDDNKTIYFNPGAVGLNNGANAVYGIVTINDNEFSIEKN